MIKVGLLLALSNIPPDFFGVLILTLGESLNTAAWILIIAILASAVLSWVAPNNYHPAARLVNGVSEPMLRPFRRIIPAMQGIDLSPILALLALNLIIRLAVHPLMDLGKKIILQGL